MKPTFDRVKEIVLSVVRRTDNVILDVEKFTPQVRLERYLDSSVEVVSRCWTKFENYWKVYYFLTESIKKELEKNDILIPFNQLDVHIIDKK